MLSKVIDIAFLVSPFDPTWRGGESVDEHQAVDALRVLKGQDSSLKKPAQNVPSFFFIGPVGHDE